LLTPGRVGLAAEQTFFLTMTQQVSTLVPEIRDGKIELPMEAELAKLVDWELVRQLAYNI
jgi:hypothetical protein